MVTEIEAGRATEKIGKITLDLTYYSGADLYCDGAVEEELLQIARDCSNAEYPRIIEERRSWEILYHFSPQRENIVEWLPVDKSMKVLEIGSGCGAITGVLSRKAGYVDCVDLSKKRSMINAYRNIDCDNITLHVGNFQDIEPSLPRDYDYICLIGVFEYAQAYISGDKPYAHFLDRVRKHLKTDGHIVIAIENKLGLKYWAGCKEDHLGTWFSGIEGYPEGGVVRTFTRKGLETIFRDCGIDEYAFYYPYPDYKFMTMLYSDEYLPKPGELSNNVRNFDRDRMLLFDEKKVFDTILQEGLFPLYANSYLVVIGKKPDVNYVKYSNDRQRAYQIRTQIQPLCENEKVTRCRSELLTVRKYPLCQEANAHVRRIETAYRKLQDRYQGGELRINRCKLVEGASGQQPFVELEYVEGITLGELLDQCLEQRDTEGFRKLFRKYVSLLDYHSEASVADFDPIFSNILVSCRDTEKPFDPLDNSVWTLIDYEWTYEKQVDTRELAFRAICCYLLEDGKRDVLDVEGLRQELEITEKCAEEYRNREREFQRFVTGQHRAMVELRDLIGYKCYRPQDYLEGIKLEEARGRIQIYEDRGQGFREETSYFPDENVVVDEQGLHMTLTVADGVKMLRVDPGYAECLVRIRELNWNSRPILWRRKAGLVTSNGTRLDDTDSFVFCTRDPNLMISLEGQSFFETNTLEICIERFYLGAEAALDIEKAAKRRFRL